MRLTKEQLIQELQGYFKKYGKLPTAQNNKPHPEIHGTAVYRYHFGTWNNALSAAGFEPQRIINPKIECTCIQCGEQFTRNYSRIVTKTKNKENKFCSRSCAVTYNNLHKVIGYRRSKLEAYIEQELCSTYPQLAILFNDKSAIKSELDIYIPSLRLAFELNGIFHYEPIYSNKQFTQIQNNDKRKFQACLEQGIELCIIDTSKQKYFKVETSKQYLDIIKQIINLKIGGS